MLKFRKFLFCGLLLEVDPAAIARFLVFDSRGFPGIPKTMTSRTFLNKRYFGMVIADEVLKPGKPLQKCKYVQAMHQRFVEGLDWDETEYVKLYKKKYRKMGRYGGKNGSFEIFASKKLKRYDIIFEDIKRDGYKRSASIEENVEVALDANGELLFIDGRHRLVLAQVIGLKKIPVVVNSISESFAKSILDNANSLRSQLHEKNLVDRVNSLATVPGGRNDKGVLVNAFQRRLFPG